MTTSACAGTASVVAMLLPVSLSGLVPTTAIYTARRDSPKSTDRSCSIGPGVKFAPCRSWRSKPSWVMPR